MKLFDAISIPAPFQQILVLSSDAVRMVDNKPGSRGIGAISIFQLYSVELSFLYFAMELPPALFKLCPSGTRHPTSIFIGCGWPCAGH